MLTETAFDPNQLVRDYGKIEAEVKACRQSAVLFDFPFILSVCVSGPDALKAIARSTERRLYNMAPGSIRYTLSCGQNGYLRSELTIWNEGGRSIHGDEWPPR